MVLPKLFNTCGADVLPCNTLNFTLSYYRLNGKYTTRDPIKKEIANLTSFKLKCYLFILIVYNS